MDLSAEVTKVNGIGEKTAEILKKAGIFTVRDLLYFLPRDYENFQDSVKIRDLKPGKIMVRGRISELKTQHTRRRGLNITTGKITDDTGSIRVIWFNQPYRAKQFDEQRDYYFTGSYDLKNGRYQLTSPSATLAADVELTSDEKGRKTLQKKGLIPIYSQRGQIKSIKFHQFFEAMRSEFALIPDLLPGTMEDDYIKPPDFVYPGARADALYKSHFPDTTAEITEARRYLAYEELFELLLASQLSKQENSRLKAHQLPFNADNTKRLVDSLPFKLTDAQRRATWDILQDLGKPTPMNRLLQGDVGSGKTIVAAISAFQAVSSGFQVALLAPTSILATQHYEGLKPLLAPLGVKMELLIGATKRKNAIKSRLKSGEINFLIGTHAIITDDTEFKNLALCIIDEQHRFGVGQRQKLLLKAARNDKPSSAKLTANDDSCSDNLTPDDTIFAPHLLSMTATPIPRSLQLTIFGDLDVSVIGELPKGRQKIETKILKSIDQKERLYPKISEEIGQGHQIYWICKNIEDNPMMETTSVKKQTKKLQGLFPRAKVEFLHGRMKPAEKDEIMERFAGGKIDILVSTTVVEVGVNVPNASVMVIMDAESYGLAQLHQLRGRVGRGQTKSYCYLISSSEDKPTKRLLEMEQSTDGFHLAEVDLKIRGPGEIYGALQHGALDLRIATLTDTPLISIASRQAKQVAAEFANNPENMLKYKELMSGISHYQQLTTLN
ncbi:ATP-dependent DNA helicase RecG [Candidatus Saccharibacteria bacterium]|nr:ATP-dependent DNA helicase RecG [Candidatus Saccharibacteria bacterium]